MVAPLVMGRPTRMFACITYTGEDRTAPAVCCDLSRVASTVPANPLPKHLIVSNAPNNTGIQTQSPSKSNLDSDSVHSKVMDKNMAAAMGKQDLDCSLPCTENKNSTTSVVEVATVPAERCNKRERCYSGDVDNKPAKLRKIESYKEEGTKGGKKTRKTITKREASSMLVENERLKFENEQLKRKLLTFQMILKTEKNYDFAVKRIRALQVQGAKQTAAVAAASLA